MRKLSFATLLVVLVGVSLVSVPSAQITGLNSFSPGQTIASASINNNFSTLANASLNRITGGTLLGNVTASPGITIDGVDISTIGVWTTPTYSAGDFASSAGTWTVDSGDVATYAYTLVNKAMTVSYTLNTTSTSAGFGSQLLIRIPSSKLAAKAMSNPAYLLDNTVRSIGVCSVLGGGNTISCMRMDAANLTSSAANTTYIQGQITFEVQ